MGELVFPGIALSEGRLSDSTEVAEKLIGGHRVSKLHGLETKLRWQGTGKYLCITEDGWAVPGEERCAATVLMTQTYHRGQRVPDTYTFRIIEPGREWHHAWLSFQWVNHLGFGAWLGAYADLERASPYKIIQDSMCKDGAFKLLCAWTGVPAPAHRSVTGLYVVEQLSGDQLFVGHGSDRQALVFELMSAA